jgi:hypothetical protein
MRAYTHGQLERRGRAGDRRGPAVSRCSRARALSSDRAERARPRAADRLRNQPSTLRGGAGAPGLLTRAHLLRVASVAVAIDNADTEPRRRRVQQAPWSDCAVSTWRAWRVEQRQQDALSKLRAPARSRFRAERTFSKARRLPHPARSRTVSSANTRLPFDRLAGFGTCESAESRRGRTAALCMPTNLPA